MFCIISFAIALGLVIPPHIQAQDDYMFLSRKGVVWQFQLSLSSGEQGTITIVNEGNMTGTSTNSTVFSWTFKNTAGVTMVRLELAFDYSRDGILLLGTKAYSGSRLVSSERMDPPMLALRLPLEDGQWEYRGFKVSGTSRKSYMVTNTVRSVQVHVPAGIFDAFEIQGHESTGTTSIEYWVKNIGLVKVVQTQSSGKSMTAQLVGYSLSGEAPSIVTQINPPRMTINEEMERQHATHLRKAFAKKNSIQAWPHAEALEANPFVYQGRTVAILAHFQKMLSATEGLFHIGTTNVLIVSDIPGGVFTYPRWVILAGIVVGKKEVQLSSLGKATVPHIKYISVMDCHDQHCNGMGK